jgi:predicted ArsR family transcriptional regulator
MKDTGTARPAEPLEALALLEDPQRAALYRFIAAQDTEISREDAAKAVGLKLTTAAFHLDKLAHAGLLRVTFRRLGERKGRGGGRPTKLYGRATSEVSASVPPRAYQTVARLLADTVQRAGADDLLCETARKFGTKTGRALRADAAQDIKGDVRSLLEQALARQGFEPRADGAALRLSNCPFHLLAEDFMPTVCSMNLALLEGLLSGLEAGAYRARQEFVPGHCCVVVTPADEPF